jgi:membrane-bound lytic murein transglycosylase B
MLKFFILSFYFFIPSFATSLKDGIKLAKLECELKPEERKEQMEMRKIKEPSMVTEEEIASKRKEIENLAIESGVSQKNAAMARTLLFVPNVSVSEVRQPEKILSFEEYFSRTMPASKILDAKNFLIDNFEDLEKIENEYKVDKEIIVALILIETYFGRVLGKHNIMDSLFSLILTSHRPQFWQTELLNVFTLIERGNTLYNRDTKGSWAGAVGMVQFITSSFMKLAKDGDGDGKIDTVNNKLDAFASAANYLKISGWKYNTPFLKEIKLNLTQDELCIQAGMPFQDGVLVIPDKKLDTQTFVVYNNFAVVLLWNKSLFFGTTVGIIYNELKNVSSKNIAKSK